MIPLTDEQHQAKAPDVAITLRDLAAWARNADLPDVESLLELAVYEVERAERGPDLHWVKRRAPALPRHH